LQVEELKEQNDEQEDEEIDTEEVIEDEVSCWRWQDCPKKYCV
jgi:hypothetical protein